jgi:hypothetical protein
MICVNRRNLWMRSSCRPAVVNLFPIMLYQRASAFIGGSTALCSHSSRISRLKSSSQFPAREAQRGQDGLGTQGRDALATAAGLHLFVFLHCPKRGTRRVFRLMGLGLRAKDLSPLPPTASGLRPVLLCVLGDLRGSTGFLCFPASRRDRFLILFPLRPSASPAVRHQFPVALHGLFASFAWFAVHKASGHNESHLSHEYSCPSCHWWFKNQ